MRIVLYRATTRGYEAWGVTAASAVDALEQGLPGGALMEDALVEAITNEPPGIEVSYVENSGKDSTPQVLL